MRKLLSLLATAVLFAVFGAAPALAASNPSITGQPDQSCQSLSAQPNGFTTTGFTNATLIYAGAGHSTVSNNTQAVSQYDVACYQLSSKP